MALIRIVRRACARLANHGWRRLLARHSLDIAAADLEAELAKPLQIDRSVPGFEDFAAAGQRGIEPGRPAESLLYHAFASPAVLTDGSGRWLTAFPTPAEIDAVESYVFARRLVSLAQLRAEARGALAVVIFACEYRPGHATVHGTHADLVFSRTGIARVGTAAPLYVPESRGFTALGAERDIRVLPARYVAYLAAQRSGERRSFGPLDFQNGDDGRRFWVPLHKLFDGRECLAGLDLRVKLDAHHVNEKLRRIRLQLGEPDRPELKRPPFRFTAGLAEFSRRADLGRGWLVPVPHPLIKLAPANGAPLAFAVPAGADHFFSTSLRIPDVKEARHAPEYVHVRHRADGYNFNEEENIESAVQAGGYRSKHYVDYTADGWIDTDAPVLAGIERVSAYSLVAPPDFFPSVSQAELVEWTRTSVPARFRETIWEVYPETLANTRMPANLQLHRGPFGPSDTTVTAVVSLPAFGAPAKRRAAKSAARRVRMYLPDTAAGEFAPGWDVASDRKNGTDHLASYGLGSPFPEDVKLCAALSTFWPAVAPDTARTYAPRFADRGWPTICPLTDEEIGATGRAWDNVRRPRLTVDRGQRVVSYPSFPHVDYVETARDKRFLLKVTAAVGQAEYERRILFMARLYEALGVTARTWGAATRQKSRWALLSFRPAGTRDAGRRAAERAASARLDDAVYRFEIFEHGARLKPTDPRRVRVSVQRMVTAYVDDARMLLKHDNGPWRRRNG